METFLTLTRPFEGKPFTTLTWRNRPAWVARHVGQVLGYSGEGKRLTNKILGDWNPEFQDGRDYAFLEGDELAAFRAMTADGPEPVSAHARNGLLVLFESGLNLVLLKTRSPIGVRLRRFLADEVLPQLARRGYYVPTTDPDDALGAVDSRHDDAWTPPPGPTIIVTATRPSMAERREDRLLLQARTRAAYVDLCDRRFRVAALHRVSDTLRDVLDPGAMIALEVVAGEIATGLSIESLFDGDDDPLAEDAQGALPFDRSAA
jgi:prophage antirepressor-like protein